MKSTEINFPKTESTTDKNESHLNEARGPLRSLRPQKSMVRVKSLKPKRMIKTRKVSIRTLKS